jgi:hypothetical protein
LRFARWKTSVSMGNDRGALRIDHQWRGDPYRSGWARCWRRAGHARFTELVMPDGSAIRFRGTLPTRRKWRCQGERCQLAAALSQGASSPQSRAVRTTSQRARRPGPLLSRRGRRHEG